DIFLGANNPDSFGLSNGQLHEMTADTLRIGSTSDTGDIFVTMPITADGHIATLSLRTGGAILDSDRFELTDITVDNLALQAAAGIGSGGDLDVAGSNLAFDKTPSGGVRIGNGGALTSAAVAGLLCVSE